MVLKWPEDLRPWLRCLDMTCWSWPRLRGSRQIALMQCGKNWGTAKVFYSLWRRDLQTKNSFFEFEFSVWQCKHLQKEIGNQQWNWTMSKCFGLTEVWNLLKPQNLCQPVNGPNLKYGMASCHHQNIIIFLWTMVSQLLVKLSSTKGTTFCGIKH